MSFVPIGIGIFDTAYQIKRLQGNASDKFLEIVTPTDLSALLEQIPMCNTIMTTGDKATDTLMQHFPDQPIKPMIGQSVKVGYDNRELSLYQVAFIITGLSIGTGKKSGHLQTVLSNKLAWFNYKRGENE